MAYVSRETGRDEIYVVTYPVAGSKTQVSIDGGRRPRWNRSGGELFFRAGEAMMVVDVETGASFRAGSPRQLFEHASDQYDVAPEGKRFLTIKPVPSEGTALHVILNWTDDLRKRVPLSR